MRFVWTLPPLLFLAAFAACATDAADEPGGGDDGGSSITFDAAPSDGTVFDSTSNTPDNFVPFEASPPLDTGIDEPTPPLEAAGPCALYAPCDPSGSPFQCNVFAFFNCEEVKWDLDAGLDAGDGGDAQDAGPPPKGLCIPADFSNEQCGDGMNHCAAGEYCLRGPSPRCLHAQDIACLCNTPSTAGACGPP
jgi:hypothetical protein